MTSEDDRLPPLVLALDAGLGRDPDVLAPLLGGKGAGLTVMTDLGLPVPAGFTMTTVACRRHLAGGWSDDHDDAIRRGIAALETRTGRRLGSADTPLTVSVRSGAEVSMPGMLDTRLDVGGTADAVAAAVRDVIDSWTADRAVRYRAIAHIEDTIGTAVTVQAMVFGDLGPDSGTGVAFSRDPSTGAAGLMGDVLVDARGDDVVDGAHDTLRLAVVRDRWPAVWEQLGDAARRLEIVYGDMVDIEFTVERGALWLLQVRRGKRSAAAAFRIAVDLARDPDVPVDRPEAIRRVRHLFARPPTAGTGIADGDEVAHGLPAAPGWATGRLCLDVDVAVEHAAAGTPVVLVRHDTSPADIRGIASAVGLVTTTGGLVSHAAVVARDWGIPAVVGATSLVILDDAVEAGGVRIAAGETVTVDGDTGRLLRGSHAGDREVIPEVATIRAWADELGIDVGDA